MRTLIVLLAGILALAPQSSLGNTDGPPAFPGARGFGATSAGGRGGDVYHVTTTADSGPGSLRYGIETASQARTIVFEIGGTIDLSEPLIIDKSRVTIAGQTAPGGIGVRGYPTFIRNASDVVVRYMRFRTGDINAAPVPGRPDRLGKGNKDLPGDAADSLSVVDAKRVIIDHVSASWGIDETLSVTMSENVTVQSSIISESLNNSYHPESTSFPPFLHGFGSLLRGNGGGGYTFWGNLYAHHFQRSPAVGGGSDPEPGVPRAGLDFDFINNVVYDWGVFPSHTVRGLGQLRINHIGNVYVGGPSTLFISFCKECAFVYVDRSTDDELLIYQTRNLADFDGDGVFGPHRIGDEAFVEFLGLNPLPSFEPLEPENFADAPFDFPRRKFWVLPARIAYWLVLHRAGASLSRDEIDRRVVEQVRTQSGAIIDSQVDVGEWPEDPPATSAPADADRDGMADAWECRRGLDPNNAEDRNGFDLSRRYTNLEVYLAHSTRPWALRHLRVGQGCVHGGD